MLIRISSPYIMVVQLYMIVFVICVTLVALIHSACELVPVPHMILGGSVI